MLRTRSVWKKTDLTFYHGFHHCSRVLKVMKALVDRSGRVSSRPATPSTSVKVNVGLFPMVQICRWYSSKSTTDDVDSEFASFTVGGIPFQQMPLWYDAQRRIYKHFFVMRSSHA